MVLTLLSLVLYLSLFILPTPLLFIPFLIPSQYNIFFYNLFFLPLIYLPHYIFWLCFPHKSLFWNLGGKKKHIEKQKSHQSWQQTVFLSGLMWGSDEYDGFPVINQTAACLSLGWPPVQNASAPPGGASAETAEPPLFSLFLSPSPSSLYTW